MAITAEQVQDAVAKFLPRNLGAHRSRETGQLDQASLADRALQIARTAVLFDIEAPIASLSTAVTAWAGEVQAVLDQMATLVGNDVLLSLRDEAPHFIDDFTDLERASSKLAQVSGALAVDGVLSATYLDSFFSDIESFVDENVAPNVQNRNRVVIRKEVKALYAALEPAWLDVLAKKDDLLSQVDAFVASDLQASVAGEVVLAIRDRIGDLLSELKAANASEQAALAEELLVDLAAARAALKIISNAPTPEGVTVIAPSSDGETPNDYLQRSGQAIPEPIQSVTLPSGDRYSSGGRIHLTDLILSGGEGESVDDADGDSITDVFRHIGATFVADGVQEGHFLFLALTGQTYRITNVTAQVLEVTPEIPNDISSDPRYLILEDIIGTYFRDEGESFWTVYNAGETGSNVVMSGSAGAFPRDVRLEGTNGSNSKDYSLDSSGTIHPRKEFGTSGETHGNLTVEDTNLHLGDILESASDGQLYNSNVFDSASSTFQTSGVRAGDKLHINSGTQTGVYEVQSVSSETRVVLTTTQTAEGPGLVFNLRTNSRVRDPTARFTAAQVGQAIIFENPAGGWYYRNIDEYVDASNVFVGAPYVWDNDSVTPKDWALSTSTSTEYDRFYAGGMDTFGNLYEVGDTLVITNATDLSLEAEWVITAILDQTSVQVDFSSTYSDADDAPPPESGISWRVQRSDSDVVFTDDDAEFLTAGVEAGDILYLDAGTGPDVGSSFTVAAVETQTTLTVTSSFTQRETDIDWHVAPAGDDFFRDPDVLMPTGVLDDDIAWELASPSTTPSGQEGDYALDTPGGVGAYTLTTTDTLTNSTLYRHTNWKVQPSDDLTYYFDQSDLDFNDYDGGGSRLRGYITLDGISGASYLKVDGYDAVQIARAVPDDLYDPSGNASKCQIIERVAFDNGPLDWEVWRGLTTDTFTDTTNSPFGSTSVGDVIRLDPGGPGQVDLIVIEAVSASEVKVSPEIGPNQTGLTYAIFNSVKPGMQLVSAGKRITIVDVYGENVLKLEKPLPSYYGKDRTWYVVLPSQDIETTYLTDRDSTFLAGGGFGTVDGNGYPVADDWVGGSDIHLMGSRPIKAKIVGVADPDGDGICETVICDAPTPLTAGAVGYKILDFEEKKTYVFNADQTVLSSAAVGDVLTVWGQDDTFEATDSGADFIEVDPRIPAGLQNQHFVVVRGGAEGWGRFLLLRYLLDQLTMDTDLDTLKLRLAEVVADFGGDVKQTVGTGLAASFKEDGDEDGSTPILTVPRDTSISYGDQVLLDLAAGGEVFSYIASVTHTPTLSVITLFKEFDQTDTINDCDIVRNSVSFVLAEVKRLSAQVQSIADVSAAFKVPASEQMGSVKELFEQLGLDAAVDALNGGDLESLTSMTSEDSSYASAAEASVTSTGRTTAPAGTSTGTSSSRANVAGVDPATGTVTVSSDTVSSSSSVVVPEDVETVIALGDAAAWIKAQKRTYQLSQLSLDELRTRRIYELCGENDSGLVTDTDPALPWLEQTGSEYDRVREIEEAAYAALDYMIDNPDKFEDVETS